MDDMRLDPASNEPARQPEAVAAGACQMEKDRTISLAQKWPNRLIHLRLPTRKLRAPAGATGCIPDHRCEFSGGAYMTPIST
jgi:hypothetical protein